MNRQCRWYGMPLHWPGILLLVCGCNISCGKDDAGAAGQQPPAQAQTPDGKEASPQPSGGNTDDPAGEETGENGHEKVREADEESAEETGPPAQLVVAKPPYKPGEEMWYTLKWSGIAGGRVILRVQEPEEPVPGKNVFRITSTAESSAFVSAFFRVRDYTTSVVDAEGGFTYSFNFRKNEGDRHQLECTVCDYDAGTAHFVRYGIKGKDKKDLIIEKDIPLHGPVVDPVTAFFYYRQVPDFHMGKRIRVPVLGSRNLYNVEMKVARKALIKVRGKGVVKALKLEPMSTGVKGPMLARGDAEMWLEEKTRVPLRISVDLPFGSMTMYLVRIKNVEGFRGLNDQEIRAARKEGFH